ncbi:MAG: hypothetical protein PW843_18720 [Azospirillaceae bacterium]|nr:hypothetical protein [Azospirillaceae bacterium]
MDQNSTYALVLREHIADLDPLIARWTSGHFILSGMARDEAAEFVERLRAIRSEMVGRMGRPDLDARLPRVADGLMAR